jgi:hypothetical protein
VLERVDFIGRRAGFEAADMFPSGFAIAHDGSETLGPEVQATPAIYLFTRRPSSRSARLFNGTRARSSFCARPKGASSRAIATWSWRRRRTTRLAHRPVMRALPSSPVADWRSGFRAADQEALEHRAVLPYGGEDNDSAELEAQD